MTWKKYGLCLLAAAGLMGCSNDDDGGIVEVPPRTLAEVAPEDEAAIQEFLQTHFYNYEEFENPPADFNYRIVIDTIAGANADKTPLSQQVATAQLTVLPEEFTLDDQASVTQSFYYLVAREGGGTQPTIGDSVLVNYELSYLYDGSVDGINTFLWQELPFTVRGYQKGMTFLKSGTSEQIITNPDGTSSIADSGIGLVILPSGLGYFDARNTTISSYSPLVFKIELGLMVEDTDNDRDGIPTWMEDLNNNDYLYDDNTDIERERDGFNLQILSNFRDPDDDGDGTPTREEIIIGGDGSITFPDSNNNGIPDYLDPDTN